MRFRKLQTVFLICLILVVTMNVFKFSPVVFANPTYEDFENDYTEHEGAGENKLVATTSSIAFTDFERDDEGYFTKDFGSDGYFTDIEFWWDLDLSDVVADASSTSRSLMKMLRLRNAGATKILQIQLYENESTADQWKMRFLQYEGGMIFDTYSSVVTNLNPAYFKLKSVSTAWTLDCYSSTALRIAGGDGDVFHLAETGDAGDYREVYVCLGENSGTDATDKSSGVFENLDLAPDTEKPQWSNPSNSAETAGQSCTFNVSWTDNVNMSSYIFSWNIHNGSGWVNNTAVAWSPPSTPVNSSTVKTLPDNATWIEWKVYANDTSDNWNNTDTQTFWCWQSLPNVSEFNLGQSQGGTFWQGSCYYNASATGGKEYIYVAYANSSAETWSYEIRAFDLVSSSWTPAYTIGTAGGSNSHWFPTVNVLPDGRLIVFYGYYEKMKFRISTNNANTTYGETLLNNWESEQEIRGAYATGGSYSGAISYPMPIKFDDTLLVFVRDGVVTTDGGVSMFKWKTDVNFELYVNENTTDYTDWDVTGVEPYLNNSVANYISLEKIPTSEEQGYFGFSNVNNSYYIDTYSNVEIEVYYDFDVGSTNVVHVYLYNGSWHDVGTLPYKDLVGWHSLNVTDYLTTKTLIDNAQIYFSCTAVNKQTLQIYKARLNVTGTGFDQCEILTYPDDTYVSGTMPYYPCANIQDDKVMITYTIATHMMTDTIYQDICFIYTDDEGETWKYVNGTSFTTPISFNQSRIVEAQNMTRGVWSPIIDTVNDNRLMMGYNQLSTPYLLYYNTTVGNVGTWENSTMKYENGTVMGSTWFHGFMDTYYDRISFWATPDESNSTRFLSKYVQIPDELYKFRQVWTDPTYNYTVIKEQLRFGLVQNAPEAYEAILIEEYWDALGNLTAKSNQLECLNGIYYGFKYTAEQTCNLTSMRWFGNFSNDDVYYTAAVYNSTFDLLGNTTADRSSQYVRVSWSLSTSFTHTSGIPMLTQGEDYWIVIKTEDIYNGTYLYYDESDTLYENMSLIKTSGSGWPSTLTDFTYYNRTARMTAYPAWLIVRGLGVDEYATTFSEIGTNTTVAGANVDLHAFVMDGSGLSHGELFWNVSGSMISNGTVALSGTESWANFSRSFPDEYVVVMWLIHANDTFGNVANCTTQYTQIYRVRSYDFSSMVNVTSSSYVWKEKIVTESETCAVTTESTVGKSKLMYSSETIQPNSEEQEWKAKSESFTGSINLVGTFDYLGRESLFTSTETIQPIGELNFWKALMFTFNPIITPIAEMTVQKELLLLDMEVINSETAQPSALMYVWKELTFIASETVQVIATSNFWRELSSTFTSFINPVASLTIQKELFFAEYEEIYSETVQPSVLLYLWKELSFQASEIISLNSIATALKEKLLVTPETISPIDSFSKSIAKLFTLTEVINLNAALTALAERLFTMIEVFDTVNIILTFEPTFAVTEEEINIALVLATFAVAMIFVVLGLTLTKKD